MKKIILVFALLVAMIGSIYAQDEYELKKVNTDYKSVIPFDCAVIQYDGGKFSKVSGTVTIDYSDFEELGNSMSITVRVGDKSSFNVFKNVTFMICNDPEANQKVYVVNDNLDDTLLILKPKGDKMAKAFNLDNKKYIFALYNEVLLE